MKKTLPFLNFIFFILLIVFNYLANGLPLNNITTGEVSDNFSSLFAPAGFIFAIWGVIYLLLGIFVFYQMGFIGNQQDISFYRNKISFLFITSCILNITWLFSWHYQMFFLSICIMFALLINLIIIYLKINDHSTYMVKRNYIVTLPFSIYLGWIMVASIANSSIYLLSIDWNGFGFSDVFWTNIMLIIALFLFSLFVYLRGDIFIMLVFIWATYGILYKHIYELNAQYIYIIVTAAFVLGVGVTTLFFPKKNKYY